MLREVVPAVSLPVRILFTNGKTAWKNIPRDELFYDKKVVVFGLPGAFTPTCDSKQLPDFEKLAPKFFAMGIDAIYCITVNDKFVTSAWAMSQGLQSVTILPDGNGAFTRQMGMLVDMSCLDMGMRSWRYAMLVVDGFIEGFWPEQGYGDNPEDDPYEVTTPQEILERVEEWQTSFEPF